MATPKYIPGPFVLANLSLFAKWPYDEIVYESGEKWQVIIFDAFGKVLYVSLITTPLVARGEQYRFNAYAQGTVFVIILHFSITKSGMSVTSRETRLPSQFQKLLANGKTEIVVNLNDITRLPAGQKARRESLRRRIPPKNLGKSAHPASSLRPNELTLRPFILHSESKNDHSSPWNVNTHLTSSYVSHIRNWTGVRTPGYGSMKKRWLPVNPHTVFIRDTNDGPKLVLTENYLGFASSVLNIHSQTYPVAPVTTHDASALSKAVRNLADRIGSGLESNLAQDFAQLHQTINLLGGTLNRLTGSMSALKHGNVSKAADILFGSARPRYRKGRRPSTTKSLADNWLEMQYGWKPLLMDIEGTMKALAVFQSPTSFVRRVTTSATVRNNVASKFGHGLGAPNSDEGNQLISKRTTCKLVIYYKLDNPLVSFLAQTGFTNPINLGWEILPFSFVVDWFLPIGPYLETLSSWDGLVFSSGSQTHFTKQVTDSTLNYSRSTGTPSAWGYQEVNSSYHDEQVLLTRVKLSAFPSANVPTLKNGLKSLTHVANGLALLRSLFGK